MLKLLINSLRMVCLLKQRNEKKRLISKVPKINGKRPKELKSYTLIYNPFKIIQQTLRFRFFFFAYLLISCNLFQSPYR